MDGYETDLRALEDGINEVIPPHLEVAGTISGQLNLLERGEPSRMTGHGTTGGGLALAMTCTAFANLYLETAQGLIDCGRSYAGALETFRDTLRQVLETYRQHELRQEQNFRTILRDDI
jgi:hypothetical protein